MWEGVKEETGTRIGSIKLSRHRAMCANAYRTVKQDGKC